jgi:carbon storage regulator
MLVLSRKEGEQIQIGDDIVLTISRIQGNRVSIGIEAPPKVAIRRGELSPQAADHNPPRSPLRRH